MVNWGDGCELIKYSRGYVDNDIDVYFYVNEE